MTGAGRFRFSTLESRGAQPLGTLYVRLLLLAVLTLGLAARVSTFRSPLFDFHSWRQADTASIARNFIEERFNPLYPQVDWRGAQPVGYVETGLELHAFGVALLSQLLGFSSSLGRLLNTLLFPLAAFLLFRFVQRRYGDEAALTGVFIYSVGLPLTMFMDRAFMNEALLALLSIVCLWAAQLYCARERFQHLAILAGASILIAVVKPTYLVVWGAVAGLFIERFGPRGLFRWELWLAGLVTAASATAWFLHARGLFELTGLSFGVSDKFLDPNILLSLEYPFKIARRLVKDVLGPVTAMFAAAGCVLTVRSGKYAESLGVLAFLVYLVIVTTGNFHHNYYQLPIAPLATVLASLGIVGTLSALADRYRWQWPKTLTVYCAVLWLVAMSTLVRNVSAHNWYELNRGRMRLCEDLKPLLAPSDRLVFVNDPSPDVLFCLDRKGWLLSGEQSMASVQSLMLSGGSVVVLHQDNAPLRAELETIGQLVTETPDFVALRLTAPPANR